MLNEKQLEQVKTRLFNDTDSKVYAVIDGASCPELRYKIYDLEPISECLWSGHLEPDVEETAPYLALLQYDHPFTDWLIQKGWGLHWNIFATSTADFTTFRTQMKKLQIVRSPTGKALLFRFYDPRVLSIFLPTCDDDQLLEMFEEVNDYFTVGKDSDVLMVNRLDNDEEKLMSETLELQAE